MGAGSTTGSHAEGTSAAGKRIGDGLYEREAELAALSSALGAPRSGKGELVVVEGPAGIGKSRLLAEARLMAAARGMMVLTAGGLP